MLYRLRLWLVILTLLVVGQISLSHIFVYADISSCEASVTPHTIMPSEQTELLFEVENTSANAAVWVTITRPSTNFNIEDAEAVGWAAEASSSEVILTGGSLPGGSGMTVSITVTAAGSEVAASDWQVQISDDESGSAPFNCSGSLGIAISSSSPDSTPPNIFNISVSSLQTTAATITWGTDEPASSQISYGLDENYDDSTNPDNNLKTSHSFVISGLSPNTVYHYMVISRDSNGNETNSGDNTLLTPLTNPVANNSPISPIAGVKPVPTESVPPVIELTGRPAGVYQVTPTVTGLATDNEAVVSIEYSTDNGINWLPVDTTDGLGSISATFAFTPLNLKDGNYILVVRAIDSSGNQSTTEAFTLIIDLLPPIVGGNVMSIGSQPILPDSNNTLTTIVGVEHKIALSAVGGPININLVTVVPDSEDVQQSFNLTQNARTGLWSGIMSFSEIGTFQLLARSVDGAGNTTSRSIATVNVKAAGKITADSGQLSNTTVSVYYRDTETNTWVLWDGAAYGQSNPNNLGTKPDYSLYLPEGTYYLKISALGYRSVVTHSFTLDAPTAVSTDFTLSRAPGINLGRINLRLPWPSFRQSAVVSTPSAAEAELSPVLDKSLPQFDIALTDGRRLSSLELFGKPTIISFVSTWAPPAQEQLANLAKLDSTYLNVVTVGSGESAAKLLAYLNIAGFPQPILADTEQRLIQDLNVGAVPSTFFVDRRGVVKKVRVGVLTTQELVDNVVL